MDIGVLVEGHAGLTWERWSRIVRAAEDAGLASVFRSDHFFVGQRQSDSLEAFLSFVVAALETERIRFGGLVSPITFRTPVEVGRMAAELDGLSDGRFRLGIGAGWNEDEHRAFGIPFPPVGERMDRLEDALQMMRAMWGPEPATYHGRFYRLEGADLRPKPPPGRPRVIIGGTGERRLLRLVARYADEWNCQPLTAAEYERKRRALDAHCEADGRDPSSIKRSMMIDSIIGHGGQDIERATKLAMRVFPSKKTSDSAEYRAVKRADGWLVGDTAEAAAQIEELEGLGDQRAAGPPPRLRRHGVPGLPRGGAGAGGEALTRRPPAGTSPRARGGRAWTICVARPRS